MANQKPSFLFLKKSGLAALLLAPIAALVLFWLKNTAHNPLGNLLAQDAPMLLLALGRLSGLLAVYGILVQLIIIGRVAWVEQVFGMDRLSRLHHALGAGIIILILAHPLCLGFSYARQLDVTFWAQIKDFVLNWDDVGFALIGFCVFVTAIFISHSMIRKRMRYETWYFTHLLLYIAIGLSIGHQFEVGGDFTANSTFKFFWTALYAFTGLNLIYYRFFRPARLFLKHNFYVAGLYRETDDVTSVVIKGRDMDKLTAMPGQFIIVRFLAPGFWREAHPFSISARPDGQKIRISIKKSGDFTARVPEIKTGTKVLIDGPHGILTPQNAERDKILLIAGGIGITPLFSLAEDFLKDGRDTILFYSNRTRASMAFGGDLTGMASASKCFKLVPVISADPSWQGETGHIDRDKIYRLAPDVIERDVFVCGPPMMMKGVLSALRSMGVPRAQIHSERFSF